MVWARGSRPRLKASWQPGKELGVTGLVHYATTLPEAAYVSHRHRGRGMDGAHEPLDDAELVVDDLGERHEAVGRARHIGDLCTVKLGYDIASRRRRTTVCLESYESRLTPHTNIGASAEGAEMMTFLAPPFR